MPPPPPMQQLWATGNNAWHQLDFSRDFASPSASEPHDLWTFRKVLEALNIHDVVAGEFGTLVRYGNDEARRAGAADPRLDLPAGSAVAATGRVVDIHGVQTTLSTCAATATPSSPPPLLALPADTTAIVAGSTHFAAVTAGGRVLTWGDARHSAPLGRELSGAAAAEVPGVVGDLEELEGEERVVKVVAGGYATGALTGGGDGYVWGAGWAAGSGSGEEGEGEGEGERVEGVVEPLEMEVKDMAVGDGWGIVVDSEGVVWVRGTGESGELGLGEIVEVVEAWTRVEVGLAEGWVVRRVWAGPATGFLLVEAEGGGETEECER